MLASVHNSKVERTEYSTGDVCMTGESLGMVSEGQWAMELIENVLRNVRHERRKKLSVWWMWKRKVQ